MEQWTTADKVLLGLFLWGLGLFVLLKAFHYVRSKKTPMPPPIDPNRIMEECKAERGLPNNLRRWQKDRGV